MDDVMLGELMAVVGTFNQTNRLADGYQVEVDAQLMRASEGVAPARPPARKSKPKPGAARQRKPAAGRPQRTRNTRGRP
jgi:hypothetical protein